jgi:hypothetical protein
MEPDRGTTRAVATMAPYARWRATSARRIGIVKQCQVWLGIGLTRPVTPPRLTLDAGGIQVPLFAVSASTGAERSRKVRGYAGCHR